MEKPLTKYNLLAANMYSIPFALKILFETRRMKWKKLLPYGCVKLTQELK
jgi:hypothetical protein